MFHCYRCTKTFSTSAHLIRHAKSHESHTRKYACTVPGCSQQFYRSDARAQHQTAHLKRYEREMKARASKLQTPPTPTCAADVLLQAAEAIQKVPQ
ncbi:hypothetical protein HDU79_003524, partial [Rhizoclosmatium sp. JEL0117]